MASVTAPLISLDAEGSVNRLTWLRHSSGRHTVRRRQPPANPRTDEQRALRAIVRWCATSWANQPQLYKDSWQTAADNRNIPPICQRTGHNVRNWSHFIAPTSLAPTVTTGPSNPLVTLTATGGIGQITISATSSGTGTKLGALVYLSLITGFTPTWPTLAHILTWSGNATNEAKILHVSPGTYFLRAQSFNQRGKKYTLATQIAAVVT